MNPNFNKLVEIAAKPVRHIIGLMSGTSLDGLDIALCKFQDSGIKTKIDIIYFKTVSYPSSFKKELKSVFSKKVVDLQKLTLLNAYIGSYFGELVMDCLQEWNFPIAQVDLIASHGQTVFHAPRSQHKTTGYSNATLQIGDGDHLAVKTGIITLSDFRQKHVAAGGEGAPLAVYGDFLLFSDERDDRILLNIGGIANLTYLPAGRDAAKVFTTDIGPGNTLMDQFVQKNYSEKYYDKDASIAKTGTISEVLLSALKNHAFFQQGFPKTTGPELFNMDFLQQAQIQSDTSILSNQDVLATLCRFTADMIIDAILSYTQLGKKLEIYLSGGGMHNPLLLAHLQSGLSFASFSTTETLGILPDAKEAVLFALLANEYLAGNQLNLGNNIPRITLGKLSFPG